MNSKVRALCAVLYCLILVGFVLKTFFFSINVGNCIHVKTKNSSYNEMIFHKEDF